MAKVYINLIDQKEPTLDFSKKEISGEINGKEKIDYFKKIIKPSNVEFKKHKEFIKLRIKKNFFT